MVIFNDFKQTIISRYITIAYCNNHNTWVASHLTGKTISLAPHSTAILINLQAQARFLFFSDVTDN